MVVDRIIASCSYCERKYIIQSCIEMAKSMDTCVILTVYRGLPADKVIVTISKTSKDYKIVKYIENNLSVL